MREHIKAIILIILIQYIFKINWICLNKLCFIKKIVFYLKKLYFIKTMLTNKGDQQTVIHLIVHTINSSWNLYIFLKFSSYRLSLSLFYLIFLLVNAPKKSRDVIDVKLSASLTGLTEKASIFESCWFAKPTSPRCKSSLMKLHYSIK